MFIALETATITDPSLFYDLNVEEDPFGALNTVKLNCPGPGSSKDG